MQVDFNILNYSALSRAPCVGAQCQGADLSHSDPHTRDVITCHCNVQVRSLRATKSAGQPLGSGNSSSLGTGSYGIAATTLGLGADANGLLNAIINRLPPGSLSSETSHGKDSAPQSPLWDTSCGQDLIALPRCDNMERCSANNISSWHIPETRGDRICHCSIHDQEIPDIEACMHRPMPVLNRTEMKSAFATGPDSARMSSQSIRSVTRGSLGLNPSDPLQRQNEEVLQVGHFSVPL